MQIGSKFIHSDKDFHNFFFHLVSFEAFFEPFICLDHFFLKDIYFHEQFQILFDPNRADYEFVLMNSIYIRLGPVPILHNDLDFKCTWLGKL